MDCDFNQIKDSYIATLKKWNQFDGRSTVREFWTFTFCNIAISIAISVIGAITCIGAFLGPLVGLFMLATSVAVGVRRLHDTNRSGMLYLLVFTCIGIIPLIYWATLDGTAGDNQYGPDPKAAAPVDTPPAA